jgi:hypothetical protein
VIVGGNFPQSENSQAQLKSAKMSVSGKNLRVGTGTMGKIVGIQNGNGNRNPVKMARFHNTAGGYAADLKLVNCFLIRYMHKAHTFIFGEVLMAML